MKSVVRGLLLFPVGLLFITLSAQANNPEEEQSPKPVAVCDADLKLIQAMNSAESQRKTEIATRAQTSASQMLAAMVAVRIPRLREEHLKVIAARMEQPVVNLKMEALDGVPLSFFTELAGNSAQLTTELDGLEKLNREILREANPGIIGWIKNLISRSRDKIAPLDAEEKVGGYVTTARKTVTTLLDSLQKLKRTINIQLEGISEARDQTDELSLTIEILERAAAQMDPNSDHYKYLMYERIPDLRSEEVVHLRQIKSRYDQAKNISKRQVLILKVARQGDMIYRTAPYELMAALSELTLDRRSQQVARFSQGFVRAVSAARLASAESNRDTETLFRKIEKEGYTDKTTDKKIAKIENQTEKDAQKYGLKRLPLLTRQANEIRAQISSDEAEISRLQIPESESPELLTSETQEFR